MTNQQFQTPAMWRHGGRTYRIIDLPAGFGADLPRLPFLLRVLAETVLRRAPRDAADMRAAFGEWLVHGTSEAEIPFFPARVLMHDTTCGPALVDIAAMRSALADRGGDPGWLNPVVRVDISVDHSVAVDRFGAADACSHNMEREFRRNAERYRFMKWATRAMANMHVHPPGTGIMHTINLEQLATVSTTQTYDDALWALPDSLIGTDSHTPMVNGLGVVGWGVGGLEAESAMLGMPVMMRIPEIVGVHLDGALGHGVLATDLALTVTHRLRQMDLSGRFVEFFGPGVTSLSVGQRAVVANMAPEYGASSGQFPIDTQSLDYLHATGRSPDHVAFVESFTKRQGLWFNSAVAPRYTEVVEIDLSRVGISMSGPRRPQDRIDAARTQDVLKEIVGKPSATEGDGLPRGPVAIAAITSCTNTTDPQLLVIAGLLARRAVALGLTSRPWVKTSLAPGSPAAKLYLERAGLLQPLAALGFDIVGYGCTTCIGNSGPLTPQIASALQTGRDDVFAVLSGNRNFPGRVHPQLDLGFLASPALVVAFAIAGDVDRDIVNEPIAFADDGRAVMLGDLWPSIEEIEAAMAVAHGTNDYALAFAQASDSSKWQELEAPDTPTFPWCASSTYIRRPPFARFDEESRLGRYEAVPLLVVGDDITTDHISPAGQIERGGAAATYLVAHGDDPDDLNVFAARRGNWEAMVRGLYTNRSVRNLLGPDLRAGTTVYAPTREVLPLWDASLRYRAAGISTVIVAGERYGMGSSRDWAAKGQALLGVRAVLARSFERIHRSNLIGMGILPLILPPDLPPTALDLKTGDAIVIDARESALSPRSRVTVEIVRQAGASTLPHAFHAVVAVETALEVETLRQGGIIPLVLKRTVEHHAALKSGALSGH